MYIDDIIIAGNDNSAIMDLETFLAKIFFFFFFKSKIQGGLSIFLGLKWRILGMGSFYIKGNIP